MLLLTETQVQPCRVTRKNIFEEIVVPGLSYQNRLFFRIGQYSLALEAEARQQALMAFQESREQFLVLVVRMQDQWTLWQEDPELRPCSTRQAKAGCIDQVNLAALTQQLRWEKALEIRDRRTIFKLHKRCFRGDQLLDQLMEQLKITRPDANRLAQRLIDETQIYQLNHVKQFEDSKALYRFYVDEL